MTAYIAIAAGSATAWLCLWLLDTDPKRRLLDTDPKRRLP